MDLKLEKNNLFHVYIGHLTSRVATLNSRLNGSSYSIELQNIVNELKAVALNDGVDQSVIDSILLTE